MDNLAVESIGLLGALGIIFMIVWAVLWFLLPFAIFGVKKRLDRIVEELVKGNEADKVRFDDGDD